MKPYLPIFGCLLTLGLSHVALAQRAMAPGSPFVQLSPGWGQGPQGWGLGPGGMRPGGPGGPGGPGWPGGPGGPGGPPPPPPPPGGWGNMMPPVYVLPPPIYIVPAPVAPPPPLAPAAPNA